MTLFKEIVEVYNKLEQTAGTLDKIELLKQLFQKVDSNEIDKLIYLTQGVLHPNYTSEPPIGIAEKIAIKSIVKISGVTEPVIKKIIDESGGIDEAVGKILKQKKKTTTLDGFLSKKESSKDNTRKISLTISEVYQELDEMAHLIGSGSTLKKIDLLAALLSKCSEEEMKYILRIVLSKLRLGIADMTIINALSAAFTGSKDSKELIEEKFNIHPDLGKIGKILAEKGIDGLEKINIELFVPVKMMLAQRAKSMEDIFERMGNEFACEFKYDGERIQAHKNGNKVVLFSRNTENITEMYPDIQDLIRKLPVSSVIVEGEVVAIDKETGKIKPFQELMRRRRKYKIDEMMEQYPIELYLFDILFHNGNSLLKTPYVRRREILKDLVDSANKGQDTPLKLANQKIITNESELEQFFESSLDQCEGLMIKSTRDDSIYQAGNRGYLWLKLKKSYEGKMSDTIDVVIIGAYMGRGKRGGTYGALLCAVYNKEKDILQSICKLGSGFTDEVIDSFSKIFKDLEMKERPPNVDVVSEKLKPDVWINPKKVCSVIGDEISLSPDHRAGYGLIKENTGFAIRFPRFVGWRDDKSLEDITTVEEIKELYNK